MRIDRRIKTSQRRIYTSDYRAARLKIIARAINFFSYFFPYVFPSKGIKESSPSLSLSLDLKIESNFSFVEIVTLKK